MASWVLLVWLAPAADDVAGCRVDPGAVARIRGERVTGSLVIAEEDTRRLLECPDLEAEDRLALRIELARILDRVGLHRNTRPVAESLDLLREAEASVDMGDRVAQARIALALAEYFYRAEMSQREFPTATEHARRAQALFRELDDPVGEADAVHRLGLIELQKGNLREARDLFVRSWERSEEGPYRPIFLSDYHRHVGLVDMLSGNLADAIPHFERSLVARDEARSRDYGLFARTMLGSALIDAGRPAEARPYLEEARQVARELPSPVGELRATYSIGEMHEALGEAPSARAAYRRAEELATELGATGAQDAARQGLERLSAQDERDRQDAFGTSVP